MRAGSLDALRAGEFGVVLGADLARALGVLRGDKIALIAPQGIVTPAGVIPRLKQFSARSALVRPARHGSADAARSR
jgi:lipoprotein-releasing system permease protein